MHECGHMKFAALLCALALPLSAAAQEAQTPTSPADFGKPADPVVGQDNRRLFLEAASSGHRRRRIGRRTRRRDRLRLACGQTPGIRTAEAMVTYRRYWSLEGEIGRRSLSKRSQVGGVRRSAAHGPARLLRHRSGFRPRRPRRFPAARNDGRHARMVSSVVQPFELAAASRHTCPTSAAAIAGSVPSDRSGLRRSDRCQAFGDEPTFGRYRGFVELVHPVLRRCGHARRSDPLPRRVSAGVRSCARSTARARHNFHRWETEVQQRIPGFRPGQRLTLHGFRGSTNNDADVPFYLLYTLGGSGGLKTFRPDMLGGDGTRATLRGFRNFRFRDRDAGADAGRISHPRSQIRAHDGLRRCRPGGATHVGAVHAISARTPDSASATCGKGERSGRMDVGFGGGEGVHVFWSFGAF